MHLVLSYTPGAWSSVPRVNALRRVAYHVCVRLPRPDYAGTTHYYLFSCTQRIFFGCLFVYYRIAITYYRT